MDWRKLVWGLLIGASASAFAVSRVGGGTLSNDEMMFTTSAPADFLTNVIRDDGDISLLSVTPSAGGFDGGGLSSRPQSVQVLMLSNARPDLATTTDRMALVDLFTSQGWTRLVHSQPCVEWFEKVNGKAITSTLVWGDGHGVVLTGFTTGPTRAAVEQMSKDLVNGSCGWK